LLTSSSKRKWNTVYCAATLAGTVCAYILPKDTVCVASPGREERLFQSLCFFVVHLNGISAGGLPSCYQKPTSKAKFLSVSVLIQVTKPCQSQLSIMTSTFAMGKTPQHNCHCKNHINTPL